MNGISIATLKYSNEFWMPLAIICSTEVNRKSVFALGKLQESVAFL